MKFVTVLAKLNAKLFGQFTDWHAESCPEVFFETSSKYLTHNLTMQF